MFKVLLLGMLLAYISQLDTILCAPVVSALEVDSSDRQLDFPSDNEIPVNSIPNDNRPDIPLRPGRPTFRGRQSDGIINRIVNFFRNLLGGDRTYDGKGGNDGTNYGGVGGNDGSSGGILNFIRRSVSSIIDTILNAFGDRSSTTPSTAGAADFPYQRPKLEPLRTV